MNINREILLEMTDAQFDLYCRNAIVNSSIEVSVVAANESKFSFETCMKMAMQLQTINEEFLAIHKERKAREQS